MGHLLIYSPAASSVQQAAPYGAAKGGAELLGRRQGGRRAALLIAALKETFEANGLELEGVCPGPPGVVQRPLHSLQ